MKKTLLSPLCSALVIPGLGQILNQQLKKGLAILGAVFILFVLAVIKTYGIMKFALSESSLTNLKPEAILQKISGQDFSTLWVILTIFAIVWIFSVVDAFWAGRKIDCLTEQSE